MNIKMVQEHDIEILCDIASQTVQKSVKIDEPLQGKLIAHIRSNIENSINRSDCVFLTVGGDQLLGYILVQNYWNLSDLFIRPEAQGRGLGRGLLESALLRCFSQSGLVEHYVRVNSSLNAESFYRKHGFVDFVPEKSHPDFVIPLICYAK